MRNSVSYPASRNHTGDSTVNFFQIFRMGSRHSHWVGIIFCSRTETEDTEGTEDTENA